MESNWLLEKQEKEVLGTLVLSDSFVVGSVPVISVAQ